MISTAIGQIGLDARYMWHLDVYFSRSAHGRSQYPSIPSPKEGTRCVFQDVLDPHLYTDVQCRPLHDWEVELFDDIPGKMRSAVSKGNNRYTLKPPLFQGFHPALLAHCKNIDSSAALMSYLCGLIPHNSECDAYTHQHRSPITPTICTSCHVHSTITTKTSQSLKSFNVHSLHIPLLNCVTRTITPPPISTNQSRLQRVTLLDGMTQQPIMHQRPNGT